MNQFFRLCYIQWILWRFGLDEFLLPSFYFLPFRLLRYINVFYFRSRSTPRGERLKQALETLGPIFVKAGQLLSTRRDFLPDDIAQALSQLQDRAKPFSKKQVEKQLKKNYGDAFHSIFVEFDKTPLAAASIAQVHSAILSNGDNVVVKLLRPNIQKRVQEDLDLLMSLAKLASRWFKHIRTFKPISIVEEIAHTLHEELDLLMEAANAEQLRRHFKNAADLYVPKINWEHSSHTALVQERIFATPIYDLNTLEKSGFNLSDIAELSIKVFLKQVFQYSYFHADLHPGNLFVRNHLGKPQIVAVDFGIMGSLSSQDKRYIAENMVAFFKRDYERVAELHIACGWLTPNTRIDQFASAIRAVSEPIFARPLNEISYGQLLMRLFQVAHKFQINIQPQLLLLQKSLLNIEGLARMLDPNIEMWNIATPYLERWLKEQIGIKHLFKQVKQEWSLWIEELPKLPMLIHDVLKEKKIELEQNRFSEKNETHQHQYHSRKRATLKGIFLGSALTLLGIAFFPMKNQEILTFSGFVLLGLGIIA